MSAEQTKPETLNGGTTDDEDGVGTGSEEQPHAAIDVDNSSPSSSYEDRLPVIMERAESTPSFAETSLLQDDAQPASAATAVTEPTGVQHCT